MKIDKKIIEEFVRYLKEFSLSEIEYAEGTTKVKVSRSTNNSGILSTQDGTVAKILVKDGEPVEFGQPLISIK